MVESKILYERTVEGEEAVVIRDGLNNTNNPKLLTLFEKTGISEVLLARLLNKQYPWLVEPRFEEHISEATKLEEMIVGIADTELGPVEIADVKLFPQTIDPRKTSFHLRKNEFRGFEAILATEGKAILHFPFYVEPVGEGLYKKSLGGRSQIMKKGDLAFIPSPTANGWTNASEDFSFMYITLPPWNREFVISVT